MESMDLRRSEVERVLTHAEESCQEILDSVNKFDHYMGYYALGVLTNKLQDLAVWVVARAQILYKEHQGRGYVAVFISEREGVHALWVEDEKLVADRAYYKARGSTVLTVEELGRLLFDLSRKLVVGEWEEVLDWIKRYGKSPGLDFSKLLGSR